MCIDVIKYLTPEIGINILKDLCEIYVSDQKLFCEHINQAWEILNNINLFLNNEEKYIKKYSSSIIGGKLISNLIETLKLIFSRRQNFKNYQKQLEELFKFIPDLFYPTSFTEGNSINSNPQKVLRIEKEIFDFIDELINNSEKSDIPLILSLLLSFIEYNPKKCHIDVLCLF